MVDLVTADPPYAWQGWGALLDDLAPIRPLVVAETGAELVLPAGGGPCGRSDTGVPLLPWHAPARPPDERGR